MHPDLDIHADLHGFVTRRQIFDSGFDDKAITEMLHAGVLERIGPGLFAPAAAHRRLSDIDRHLVRCRAVATRFGDRVAFTHQSAALLHGLAVWGVDLATVQVTRLDGGRGRLQAGVRHHVAEIGDEEIVEIDGMLVSAATRAVWDLAATEHQEAALVTADAALHQRRTTEDELVEAAGAHASWRGARRAKATLSLADGRSESVGETRCRYAFRRHGLPAPEPQFVVHDEYGQVIGRTDWGWPKWRHLAEFDGMIKYGDGGDDPEAASRVVQREKVREDRMRDRGWGMTRLVWSDLSPRGVGPAMTALTRAMERSRRIYVVGRL